MFGIFSMYIGLKFKNRLSKLDIKFWNIGFIISMILLIFIREFILIAYMLNWIAAIRILEINFIKSEIQIGWKNIGYTFGNFNINIFTSNIRPLGIFTICSTPDNSWICRSLYFHNGIIDYC